MRMLIRALVVGVIVVGCGRGDPARTSVVVGGLGDFGDALNNFDKAANLLKDLKRCHDVGFSSKECTDPIWAGVCNEIFEHILDMAPEFQILGLPYEELCKGEPTLKCCKYDPATQEACHTAFNSDEPINCEGNPSFVGIAESYGPCISTGDPLNLGCTCCGIAECANPACDPAILANPLSAAWRTDTLAKKLAGAFPGAAAADPEGATAFVALDGCTAHRAAMLGIAPFAFPDSVPTDPDPGPNFHMSDNDPDARYMRGLMTVAVRRVLAGVPNIIARWQSVSARLWTDTEIDDAVASVGDANAILDGLLGDFGLALLQAAEPRLYRLLAVPLPEEPPGANQSPYVAACVPGQAPTLAIVVSTLDNTATVQLEVQDALASLMPGGEYPVTIEWGDGRADHVAFSPSLQSFAHAYAAAGSHTVRARVVNAARLIGSAEATAVVSAPPGPVDPGPPAVVSLSLDLAALTDSYTPPRVIVGASAIDPADTVYPLGHRYALPTSDGELYAIDRFTIPGTLDHPRLTPVSGLQLSSRWAGGNVVYWVWIQLGDVHLTGLDGTVTTIRPSPADVQWIPNGQTSPIAPLIDPITGTLMLPSANEDVTVHLAPGAPPFAGCRPLVSVATPTLVTAAGGCQEVDSSLTWSLASSPVNFAGAQAYCAGLTQGGVTGWRLPTDEELAGVTTTGEGHTYFAFTTEGFRGWTSSTFIFFRLGRDLATGGWALLWDSDFALAVCVR